MSKYSRLRWTKEGEAQRKSDFKTNAIPSVLVRVTERYKVRGVPNWGRAKDFQVHSLRAVHLAEELVC